MVSYEKILQYERKIDKMSELTTEIAVSL